MAEPCYYRSYRDEDGKLSAFYWKLLVVRLAFVVIFEVGIPYMFKLFYFFKACMSSLLTDFLLVQHFVFGVCRLIDAIVPDVPKTLDNKMKRDRYLAKQILQDPDHHIRIAECT